MCTVLFGSKGNHKQFYRITVLSKVWEGIERDLSFNVLLYRSRTSNKMLLLLFFAVTSRRGDLEILGYVMLQWLCGRLPWENNLANKEYVGNEKMRYYIYLVYKSMLVCEPMHLH